MSKYKFRKRNKVRQYSRLILENETYTQTINRIVLFKQYKILYKTRDNMLSWINFFNFKDYEKIRMIQIRNISEIEGNGLFSTCMMILNKNIKKCSIYINNNSNFHTNIFINILLLIYGGAIYKKIYYKYYNLEQLYVISFDTQKIYLYNNIDPKKLGGCDLLITKYINNEYLKHVKYKCFFISHFMVEYPQDYRYFLYNRKRIYNIWQYKCKSSISWNKKKHIVLIKPRTPDEINKANNSKSKA
jgi:hypothetical protein